MPSNHLILCCPLLLPPSIFPSIKVFSNESVLMGFSSKSQVSFNFLVALTIHSDFGGQENKVHHCIHFYPSVCHEVMGLDAMILVFRMLSFKPPFSLSSFTFIKRLFSSLLSVIRVVSFLNWLLYLIYSFSPHYVVFRQESSYSCFTAHPT